jgi:hypothetical protein
MGDGTGAYNRYFGRLNTGGKSPEACEEGARIVRMQLENMGLL